jgi:hypothetical protein
MDYKGTLISPFFFFLLRKQAKDAILYDDAWKNDCNEYELTFCEGW